MSTKAREFVEVLRILANPAQPLDAATIYGLSALDRGQIEKLTELWPQFLVDRRRKLVLHLNEVSESNFEMDFQAVNHIALDDHDGEVRQYALEGLWEDETPPYMHKLVGIVRSDPSAGVRAAAITELGRFILLGEYEDIPRGDARLAQNTVLSVLQGNEDDDLRRRALEAIANCSRAGIAELIEEFYEHQELQMQMSAIFAMGRTCDAAAWGDEIITELESEYPEMQYEAARAAGHLELPEAVPALLRVIEQVEDTEVLDVAIWALGEIGGDKAQQALTDIIAHAEAQDDEEILAAAQDALDAATLPGGDFPLMDFE